MSITQESVLGEELYTLAELVRMNPAFTVDQLRKWIQTGRLEAVKNSTSGIWWTSEEALARAAKKLKRRRRPKTSCGLSEQSKEFLRRRCGYSRTTDGKYQLINEQK